jgi:hypothetical protein
MLKITVVDGEAEHKLLVEGRLVATCVSELERAWNQARRARRGSRIVVDLSGTTDIDHSGKATLLAIIGEGALLTAKGIYSKYVARQLMEEARQAGPARRQHNKAVSVESNSAGSAEFRLAENPRSSFSKTNRRDFRRGKLCATPDEPHS